MEWDAGFLKSCESIQEPKTHFGDSVPFLRIERQFQGREQPILEGGHPKLVGGMIWLCFCVL